MIPAAVLAGVRTPELVAFDVGGEFFEGPYMVLRRAVGVMPGLPTDPSDIRWRTVYRQLGSELAALHQGVGALPDVPADIAADPRPQVAALAEAGYLSADLAAWVSAWFDRLESRAPAAPRARLIHGDASPTNLLVDPESGRLTAILDWGDAAWADPATEFAKLLLRAVPAVLEGYVGNRTRLGPPVSSGTTCTGRSAAFPRRPTGRPGTGAPNPPIACWRSCGSSSPTRRSHGLPCVERESPGAIGPGFARALVGRRRCTRRRGRIPGTALDCADRMRAGRTSANGSRQDVAPKSTARCRRARTERRHMNIANPDVDASGRELRALGSRLKDREWSRQS